MLPTRSVACIALATILSCGTIGRADADSPAPVAPASDPDAWRFQTTAYGWLMGVSGSMTTRGQTVDINANFFQVVDKSDSLAAFMGYVEADKNSFYRSEDLKNIHFRVNSGYSKDLRDALNPQQIKPKKSKRVRRE